MKYTLHIAFDERIAEAVLRVSERLQKFGRSEYASFAPFFFDPNDSGFIVKRPEIKSLVADVALYSFCAMTNVPLELAYIAKKNTPKYLNNNGEITDFFEQTYLKNVTVGSQFDPELHIMFYVPLYDVSTIECVERIIANLPYGYKFVINIIAITYDMGEAAKFINYTIEREERKGVMTQVVSDLVKLKETYSSLRHILLFQNRDINGWSLEFCYDKFVATCADIAVFFIGNYHDVVKHAEPERPIYAINSQSFVLDIYHALNQWMRDLFTSESSMHVLEEVDDKISDEADACYKEIVKKEQIIINDFVGKLSLTSKQYTMNELEDEFKNKCRQQVIDVIDDVCKDKSVTIKNELYKKFRNIDSLSTSELEEYLDKAIEQDRLFIDRLPEDAEIKEKYAKLEESLKVVKQLKLQIERDEEAVEQLKEQLSLEDYQVMDVVDGGVSIGGDVFKLNHSTNTPLAETYYPEVGETIPPSVDLRKYFPAIKNQGIQGSCTAFSMVAVLEYFMKRLSGNETDLSEAFSYFNSRMVAGNTDVDDGANFNDVLSAAKQYGLCAESLCPYNENIYTEKPSDEAYRDALNRQVTEAKNVRIDINDIKSALSKGYPVVVSVQAIEVMKQNTNGFVSYEEQMGKTSEDSYHAMVICGYSDNDGYFIIRNSWGNSYGDDGYCYLPYKLFRQKGIIDSCYVITGISGKALEATEAPYASLIGGNHSADYEITRNRLNEKLYALTNNRSILKKQKEEYSKLCKQLGERDIAESSIADIDKQIQEIQQKTKDGNDGFLKKIFVKKTGNSELEELLKDRNGKLLNSVIINGIRKLNLDYLSKSAQLQDTSEMLERDINTIDDISKAENDSYYRKLSPRSLDLNDLFKEALNTEDIRKLFLSSKDVMMNVVKRRIGLYELYGQMANNIHEYMRKKLNLTIADFLDDECAKQFFHSIDHSSVMAMIEGRIPQGYGEEAIYVSTPVDLASKGIKICNNVGMLESKDKYRISFLHIERYDIDDFCIFEDQKKEVSIDNNPQINKL